MPTFLLFALLIMAAALGAGCQNTSNSTTNTNSNAANISSNTAAKPDVQPKTVEPAETGTTGSLATPAEAYKTAYELRKNKDVAGLKKIMSKDIIEFLTMMGEAEKKSLDDMIKEMVDKPQADKAEVRNEKIDGDWAELEYLTETGSWKTMDFEKVDGKWLLSFPKGDKMDGNEAQK